MIKNQKGPRDVGASKAAREILGRLDRRLRDPAGSIVRFCGFAILFLILYLLLVGSISDIEIPKVGVWLIVYGAYLLLLELLRKLTPLAYDKTWFRSLRVIINLILISILISLSLSIRLILIFAYAVPIFASSVYYYKHTWAWILIVAASILGLYLGAIQFAAQPLEGIRFLWMSLIVIGYSLAFNWFYRKIILNSNEPVDQVARRLPRSLDLQKLMDAVVPIAIDLSQADHALLMVFNKKYIAHSLKGFTLRGEHTIENVAQECSNLLGEKSLNSADLITAFNNGSIYRMYFNQQPHSTLSFPLFSSEGRVLGILNAASDLNNHFDNILRHDLASFSDLVSSEIENCLIHHELKLREARDRIASEKIVSAKTEDETIQVLVEEVRQQIPHADWIVLHQYNLVQNEELSPVCRIAREDTSKLFSWSGNNPPEEMKLHMHMGEGIAGHALEQRDTIIANNVSAYPGYIKSDNDHNVKSLLVAPLYHPNDDGQDYEYYGTLSLASRNSSAFTLEDETTITHLSTQASYEIAKYRDFERWRKHGGTSRKVLQQIRAFDIAAPESQLCDQITDSAISLFGFHIARLQLLHNEDDLITTSITGVPYENKLKSMGARTSYAELKTLLIPQSKIESTYLIRYGPHSKWMQHGWNAFDALVTPLYGSSEDVIGILTLEAPVSNGSGTSRQLLEAIGVFASAASWVLELSRYQHSLIDQKQRAQSFIDTISQELAKGRDLNTICEVVVQVGAKFLSAEGCSLYLVRGKNIVLTHSNYLASTDFISRYKPISSRPKAGLTAWVADTGEAVFYNNQGYKTVPAWAGENEHLQHLPSKKCESLLLAPVKDGTGKVIGVISLENKKTLAGLKDFDETDRDHLVSLANEFAKALEIIGLYEDIKEWERTGLAEDLHDLTNWYHSGVVSWIEAMAEWVKQSDWDKVRELMPELQHHASTTAHELKALHSTILAKSFEAASLKQSLQEVMSVWSKPVRPKYNQAMTIQLNCPDNLPMPIQLRNTMVRIASLAFSNAIRHSGITENPTIHIEVNVEKNDDEIVLAIIDNGVGMDESTPPGYGMERMRELTQKMNRWDGIESSLDIETGINKGTKVILHVIDKTQVSQPA